MKVTSVVLASGLIGALALLGACGTSDTSASNGGSSTTTTTSAGGGAGGTGGTDTGPPPWLGDAGLVVRPPVARPLHALCGIASNPGDMPLGQDPASVNLRKGYFDAALDLGGVMIRRDFRFDLIEPQPGLFAWTDTDALLDEAETRGVRILGSMLYGTLWSNPDAKDIFWPPKPEDFQQYAGFTASRYKGRVVGWEIWNEPNGGFRFWKPTLSGDPVAYGTLLTAASDFIHQGDPEANVLLGGTVFTPQLIEGAMQWLGEAYAARPDLAASFDTAGIHTYMSYPPRFPPESFDDTDPPLAAKIQMHAWLLAQHGGESKEMWITEIGWPVAGNVGLAEQASYTVRATIIAAREGAGGIFWYTLRDGPFPEASPPEDAFGLLEYDPDPAAGNPPKPKPVYTALKALLATVGDRWPKTAEEDTERAAAPEGTQVVTFHGDAPGEVYAAWRAEGQGTWSAPVAGELIAQDGTSMGAVQKGAPIPLGPDVVYLR
ncbi:MAG: hypothetical protein U0441_32565 [Polyangiaceae bacterium]